MTGLINVECSLPSNAQVTAQYRLTASIVGTITAYPQYSSSYGAGFNGFKTSSSLPTESSLSSGSFSTFVHRGRSSTGHFSSHLAAVLHHDFIPTSRIRPS